MPTREVARLAADTMNPRIGGEFGPFRLPAEEGREPERGTVIG